MADKKVIISDKYIKNRCGGAADYFASTSNFVKAAELFPDILYGEGYRDNNVEVQCTIIVGGAEGFHIDKSLLTYEQKVKIHLREFCNSTTAHGIPMIGNAENLASRIFWIILFCFAFCNFTFQAINVVEKYQRNDKIVDIQLVFEAAPFPAITICNLNPYKESSVSHIALVMRTLRAFNNAMGEAGSASKKQHLRYKRSESAIFEPAYSDCTCTGTGAATDCIAKKQTEPEDKAAMCLCAFDRHSGDAWPCYPLNVWQKDQCSTCDQQGYCGKEGESAKAPCYCQSVSAFCVADDGSTPLNLWEYYGDNEPTEDPAFLEALGFAGMTDEVAIVTKAKENIMFAMATLSMEQRRNLSNSLSEFIHKCSFNGKQCDIAMDFITRVDPVFGNCFTFNYNRTVNLTSIRAGPMYGLRILVYVNATEYLPTTEATGVKLTIHEKEEFPFPDTFGYSAPTGSISSFGIKLKRVARLPAPYGDCVMDGKTEDYIYTEFHYSTEGCYRSCFQQLVLTDCGCGDPRFPIMAGSGYSHCDCADPVARRCLDERTKELGGLHGSFRCRCQQPCEQSSYTLTYSASVWPSESLQVQLGTCDGTHLECIQHYRKHGAMIEVFYEQLNFEMMKETEAYGWVNLLSDFGGQLGLWLGVSVITCWEFVFFIIQLMGMSLRHHYEEWKKAKMAKKRGSRR